MEVINVEIRGLVSKISLVKLISQRPMIEHPG